MTDMARNETWVRTDGKLIRGDAVQAVAFVISEGRPTHLELRATGERKLLEIRIQPDRYLDPLIYMDRNAANEAAWQRAAGLDEELLARLAAAARIPGGAVVSLGHDDDGFPSGWQIEPLIPTDDAT
jgi:hypothetical protein